MPACINLGCRIDLLYWIQPRSACEKKGGKSKSRPAAQASRCGAHPFKGVQVKQPPDRSEG
ncbi:hypothetical protein DQX05_01600 [Paenibacillus thiaminolyticus]|uniref:Uncharacterized protein n=1 Tax=Paenibacillus thiaminolyticus TaxID=49283 RepID=A0A3A3GSM3_PANTH|nr:hypothetical protein DQX05_01600 [Paenibacillus thiaminolyticus]